MVSLQYGTADELAAELLKINGIVPVAIAVGICFTLTIQCFVNKQTDSKLHQALLVTVTSFSLINLTLMCVNGHQILNHPDSLADLYYLDSICLITSFLITSLTAYLSQIFFGLRAYTLWGRSRRIAIPIVLSSHVSLLSGVALDIYGLTQPRFDQTTSGADLVAVERWFEQLIRVRKGLQIVWVMSTLACDLIICVLIIVALLRMKTNSVLGSTKSLIGRFLILTMETMVPPMVMAVMFAIVIIAGKAGPGSWFRNTAAFQSVFYWFAIVWVLRTNRQFQARLNPPTSSDRDRDRDHSGLGGGDATQCPSRGTPSRAPTDLKLMHAEDEYDLSMRRAWTNTSLEVAHVAREAHHEQDLLYSPPLPLPAAERQRQDFGQV